MISGPQLAGPLYNQIQLLMRKRILAQEWREGQNLPTEVELAREYSVSVGTMRKALDVLGHAKLIVRKQGLGTFVADSKPRPQQRPSGWIVDGSPATETPVRVLSAIYGSATTLESEKLRITRHSPVARISILSKVLDRVLVVDEYTIPEPKASTSMKSLAENGSDLSQFVQSLAYQIARFVENLGTDQATASNAESLQVPIETALLRIERLALSAEFQPVYMSVRLAHLDRANYSVQLTFE